MAIDPEIQNRLDMRLNITILYAAVIAALLWLPSCSKPSADEVLPPDITGEWKLASAGSLDGSVIVKGGEAVEISVYISFTKDGNFELYQRLDELHFRRYAGTWQLDGNILSGLYDGKKSSPWACSYAVSLADDGQTLVMDMNGSKMTADATAGQDGGTAQKEKSLRYNRTTIPESVRNEAVPAGSPF